MKFGFFMYGANNLAIAEQVVNGRTRILAELGAVTTQDVDLMIASLTAMKADMQKGRFPLKKEK